MKYAGRGKTNICFCIVLLLAFSLLAQPFTLAERLPLKTYTTEDGLIRNLIRQIMQDSYGYLWLVTPSGLSRFDGYEFKNFAVGQNSLLSLFWRMIEDRRGGYWIASGGGGLYRFRPQAPAKDTESRFQLYTLAANPQASYVFDVYQDRAGKIWAGGNGGLFSMDEGKGESQFQEFDLGLKPSERPSLSVTTMIEGLDDSLWISTRLGLFRYLSDGRIVRYRLPDTDVLEVGHIFCDRDNRLWIEHSSGLIVFMPESIQAVQSDVTFRFTPAHRSIKDKDEAAIQLPTVPGEAIRLTEADGVAGRDITSACQTVDGKIWLGLYDKGLLCFDGRGFRLYTKAEGLSHYKVRSLTEDSEGNLWIGTDGGGLMKKIKDGFTGFSANDGVDESLPAFIIEDGSGSIGVATEPDQIRQFDGEKFHPLQSAVLSKMMSSLNINRLHFYYTSPNLKDQAGELWFATNDGLYRFPAVQHLQQLATATPKIYTTRDGLSDNRVYRVFEDSHQDIWISFLTGKKSLLCRWERATDTFHQYGQEQGLFAAEDISSIGEDHKGNIWLGFGSSTAGIGLLARFDGKQFRMFSQEDGVPIGTIRDLFTDKKGQLWIASSRGGVGLIEDPVAEQPQFSRYTIADGLIDNEANCVAQDRWGNIYVGLGRGLDQINPETKRIRHFRGTDGLTSDDVRKIYIDSQMNMWIGTNKGLFRFAPALEVPAPAPPVFITKLIIAGEEQAISDSGERQISNLQLATDHNNLMIDFVSPSSSFATTIRYQYRLEGADKDWSPVTDRRSINYANLSPGSYRFLVQSLNADGKANSEPATLNFTILYPIWRRWWFLALVSIFLGMIVIGIARFRNARQQERKQAEQALQIAREERLVELEQVRRRIATDLHDDVGSSLTQISLLSEVVRQSIDSNGNTNANGNGNNGNAVSRPLTLISQISQELVDSMSDIVWAINPNKDTLKDLSQRMRHFASDVLTARHIEFRFRTPDEDEEQGIKVGANLRREVYLLFKEAVNNLVKHSHCTQAEIELRLEVDTLFLEIKDDGQGFDVEQESQGNGLQSMSERSRGLGGELEIETGEEKGTRLSFMIPLSQQSRIVNR